MTAAERKRASRARQAEQAAQAETAVVALGAHELEFLCKLLTRDPGLRNHREARTLLRKLRTAK